MKIWRHLAWFLLLCGVVLAQNPISAPPVSTSILSLPVYTLNAAPVAGASLALVGSSGQTQIYYWAVANYQIGSVMSPLGNISTAPATLSGSNYVAVNPWSYPSSVVSVDILKTSSNVAPTGACNCAVATGLTSGGTNDQSNSTSSYTVTLFNPGSLGITLTNEVTGNGVSHLMYRQNGVLVKDLATSGGGTVGGTGTANSFAGWTGSSTLGNAPCTFTATAMTCSAPQTSPSGNSILSLVGGAGSGIANPWFLQAAGGVGGLAVGTPAIAASYINGGVGNHIGINVAVDVGEFTVWGGTTALLNLTASFATLAKPLQMSAPGTASTAALRFGTGGQALFTGGSGNTTWPVLYMNDCPGCGGGGNGPTTWSTSGSYFGVNAIAGFVGNFVDYRLNGGSALFQVTSAGLANAVGGFQTAAVAFSTLPACAAGTEGSTRAVSDSNTNTWGATIANGGANHILGYCDGTNWTVAAK
jgi:hypothetical protein